MFGGPEVNDMKIKKLNSYQNIYMKYAVNKCAQKTIDLMTSPGTVLLLNHDRSQLLQDKEKCHTLFDLEV